MKSTNSFNRMFTETGTWLFTFLWMYAASGKLLDYQTFKVQVSQSPMLMPIAGFVAWFIPATEILLAILLCIPKCRLTALYLSYGLMVLFAAYIVSITRFSEYVPCSCGGILEKMSWNQHLVFNLFFVALAFIQIIMYPKNISLQQIRGNRKPVETSRSYHNQ